MNKPSILITGAGGFLGKALLSLPDASSFEKIICLCRHPESIRIGSEALTDSAYPSNVTIIESDLMSISSFEHHLKGIDTVIHMAATTGKAIPQDYFNTNAYATMLLLDRCKQAGVKNFLFVSSIAAGYPNKYRYFYAQSKEKAEHYVQESGLNYTILRPTMIMGKGSPVFAGMARMAQLPVIPVFGKGKVMIQPVHVDDVARAIHKILVSRRFQNETLEIGGPESLSIETFLKQIHKISKGKEAGVLHVPLAPVIGALGIMERMIYRFLPLTAGQLASFRNESTAKPNSLTETETSRMIGINQMITDSAQSVYPVLRDDLDRECSILCQYLVQMQPNEYVLKKYRECMSQASIEHIEFTPADKHDSILLSLARRGCFFTRMTDVYSRFFRKNSIVRKKLAYLMAILEVTPPYFRYYDRADGLGLIGFALKTGIKGTTMVLHLITGSSFLLPLQILLKGKKNNPEKISDSTDSTSKSSSTTPGQEGM